MNKTMDAVKKLADEIDKRILNDMGWRRCALDEMARIGFLGNKYEVYVWADDSGYIPHLHIRDSKTRGREFETCVRLDKAEYFRHGSYTDTFNAHLKRDFAEFMEAPSRNKRYATNYEYAVDMWNDNNNSPVSIEVKYDNDGKAIIPNYRYLETLKLPK